MTRKKLLFRGFFVAASLVFLSFNFLLIQAYIATKKAQSEPIGDQLSRIDFQQPLTSSDAEKIKAIVAQMPGIKSTYVNVKDGILVFTYDLTKQNAASVYNRLGQMVHIKATPYTVQYQKVKSGCPINLDERSFSGNLVRILYHTFS